MEQMHGEVRCAEVGCVDVYCVEVCCVERMHVELVRAGGPRGEVYYVCFMHGEVLCASHGGGRRTAATLGLPCLCKGDCQRACVRGD